MFFELSLLQAQSAVFARRRPWHSCNTARARSYRTIGLAAALCLAGVSQAAPSAIAAGQLGLVSISSAGAKPVSFVLLCHAKVGTVIEFTDNGWLSAGGFRQGEGVVTWRAARDMVAGEVITFSELENPRVVVPADAGSAASAPRPDSFNIAAAGDSVIAYQGTSAQPKLVFGLNFVPSATWDANAINSNTSALPAGLVHGQTAVALSSRQTPVQDYTGLSSGTAEELLDAMANQANWTGRAANVPSAAATALTVTNAVDCLDAEDDAGEIAPTNPGSIVPIASLRSAAGGSSPLLGRTVKVSAVVTAYLPGMRGFALQEAAAQTNAARTTSDGIFVFYNNNQPAGVNQALVGKRLTLTGVVSEFRGQTQLTNISQLEIGADEPLPTPAHIALPVTSETTWEQHEGMIVQVCAADAQPLVITDTYELARFGNIVLSAGARQEQFTENHLPSLELNQAYLQQARLSRIILDNGISTQNPAEHLGRHGELLSAVNTLRAGDQTDCITGMLDQFVDPSRTAHQVNYRVQPTQTAVFTGVERPTAEALQLAMQGSNLKVASVNVLNFFVTPSNASFTVPGTNVSHRSRGADTTVNVEGVALTGEYQRQLDKLVAQLLALDADVYGLSEMQNDGFGAAGSLATLVAALNAQAGAGVYAYAGADGLTDGVRSVQAVGTDAITVAIIFNTQRVAPVGQAVVPDVRLPAYNAFTAAHGSRVPVAQTFQVLSLDSADPDALVTLVVNHFKSKGSVINGETDQGDGQGANNPSRTIAAQQLQAWLATHPTGYAQAHTIVSGDLNAYSKEDPVAVLEAAGYQLQKQDGAHYSYTFNGLWGSLDHIMTSASLAGKIDAVVHWTVNAEEPTLLDYNYNFKTRAQVENYYRADFYRASDHNPLLVGLALGAQASGPVELEPVDPEPIAEFDFGAGGGSGAGLTGSLTGGGGSCEAVTAPAQKDPSALPANQHVRFPYALLEWELVGCAPSSTVTVTMNLPEPVPANAQYWKWGPTADNHNAHWYTIPFTRTGAQQIQFQIQDGGLGDSNLQADGRIVDPGGLGVPVAVVPPTGHLNSVPVDSPWMLSLLGALLAGAGVVWARRKAARV